VKDRTKENYLRILFFAGITFYFYRLGIWGMIGGAVAGAFVGLINARELQKTESKPGADQIRHALSS
jgi:hypothetical protein